MPLPSYYYGNTDYRKYMIQVAETVEDSTNQQIRANTQAAALASAKVTDAIHSQGQAVAYGIQAVSWQLGNIQAAFVQGFTQLNDTFLRVSQDICDKLDSINDNISNPFLVQSRELYRRALQSYSKGFYEEAVEDLLKALEINKTDYISWFLLGKAYLFGAGEFSCVIDLDASIRAFVNAAKYIKPDIAGHDEARLTAAEILSHLGLARQTKAKDSAFKQKAKEDADLVSDAQRAYEQSWALSKGMLESLFNAARCDVLLGDENAALGKLQMVLQRDPGYVVKTMHDPDFKPIHANLILEAQRAQCMASFDLAADDTGEGVTITKYKGKESHIIIPQTHEGKPITSIGKYTFNNCSSLTQIIIPEGVTTIERGTFYGCFNLISAIIPEGVTSIGVAAFCGCSSLTSLVIPESVTNIGIAAFSDCISLTTECREAIERKWGKRVF